MTSPPEKGTYYAHPPSPPPPYRWIALLCQIPHHIYLICGSVRFPVRRCPRFSPLEPQTVPFFLHVLGYYSYYRAAINRG